MEDALREAVDAAVMVVEAAGALIIVIGAGVAFVRFGHGGLRRRHDRDRDISVRLELGRYLALGLEFQLASDILRTAITPTLRELTELAIVAAIRTALNFFLAREIREERAQLASDGSRS